VELCFLVNTALVKLKPSNSCIEFLAILSPFIGSVAFNFGVRILQLATVSCLFSLSEYTIVVSALKHKTEFKL
jgi:hypothetical protein